MFGLGILARWSSSFSPVDIIFNHFQTTSLFHTKGVLSNLQSKNLIKCAVDDYDFIHQTDFPTPFNWDIPNLIDVRPESIHPQLDQYHELEQDTGFNNPVSESFEDFETALDEELTFSNRSKYYSQNSFIPQQRLLPTPQVISQVKEEDDYQIDLSDVNDMFDHYLMENELLQSQLLSFNTLVKSESKLEPVQPPVQPTLKSKPLKKSVKRTKKVKLPKPTVFPCTFCSAKFKVKGYLTRHLKKHSPSKLFVCPFYSVSGSVHSPKSSTKGDISVGSRCHPTGGFSRRDTFKTHLKLLHYIYPPGTKSNSRNEVGGRCAGCFKYFENNSVWLSDHIENNECPNILHKFS